MIREILGRRRRWTRDRPRRADSERGQALVEFIVVFPLLALLIFGIIEMGAAWRTFQVTTNAAREGARLTVLPEAQEADVRAAIGNRLTQGGLVPGDATVAFSCDAACFGSGRAAGERAAVQISYPFTFTALGPIAQFMGGSGGAFGSITIDTSFAMRIE